MIFRGLIPDFERKEFFYGELVVDGTILKSIARLPESKYDPRSRAVYILPGLIDSHVHIESSMLSPANFAAKVIGYGTVATVSDPHEIANVLGEEGVSFMINDAANVPLKIHFTAPSCVPATSIENSGASLSSGELLKMSQKYNFAALGEMMNYPGVIGGDKDVRKKIDLFLQLGKKVDGHAPGLSGQELTAYIDAGISSDHEASDLEEAKEKIKGGMKILIREGSAARNFEELWPLIAEYPEHVMLCCDDIHPDELLSHHIDNLIVRGLGKGLDIFDLLRASSLNPVEHYGLDVGILKPGDKADFIIVDDLDSFEVKESYIDGNCVFRDGENQFKSNTYLKPNKFERRHVAAGDFDYHGSSGSFKMIGAIDGDLYTTREDQDMEAVGGVLEADIERDIVKIALVNRYDNSIPPSLGWIKNTGLKRGALASSIAHDNHNIIVMGLSSEEMAGAVNLLVDNQGGICSYDSGLSEILPLPIAGLMSLETAETVGNKYKLLNSHARNMGSTLKAPFMTLSFMALLVIPELKIGDRGLFDVKEFKFVQAKNS